jgi:hypothetical protein
MGTLSLKIELKMKPVGTQYEVFTNEKRAAR